MESNRLTCDFILKECMENADENKKKQRVHFDSNE